MSLAVDLKSVFPNRGDVSPPRTIMPVAPAAVKTNRAGQRIDPLTGQPLYQRQEVVSLNNAFDEPSPFAVDSFLPESVEPVAVVQPTPAAVTQSRYQGTDFPSVDLEALKTTQDATPKPNTQKAVEDLPSFLDSLYVGTQQAVADLGVGQTFDPLRTGNTEAQGKWGMAVSDINTGFESDVTGYIKDNDIPLTKEIDGKTYHLTVGKGLNNLVHGRVSDGIWIEQGPVGTYSTVYQDTSTSFFDDLINNPVTSIAASLVPFGQVALTAVKAANGQTLHGTDYLSASLSAAEGLGMLQAPVNEAAAADAGTAAMQAADVAGLSNEAAMAAGTAAQTAATTGQGFTLFGKALSYNQSVGLLTAAATGDPKSTLVSIYGRDLIKGGLNKAGVTSDALAKVGIPAAAFEAGLQKTVEKVAAGEELDDALAYGFVDYAREGGLKNLFDMPESDISFAGIEDLVRDIVRPIGSVATDLAHLVEDNTEGLEEFVRKGLSEFDDAVIQPTGEFLSDLDTEAREQLTKLDEGLYDIQSPFSTPEIDLPNFDLPSFNLPSFSMGGGMLLSGAPSGTATTGKIFEDELFKFKNKIELTEFGPLNREQEVDIEDFLTSPFESAFTTSQRFAQ